MRRLLRCPEPSRLDFAVHFSLGLAALMAVVLSLGATFDFCARLDQIGRWFSNQDGSEIVSGPDQREKNSFTNAAGLPTPLLRPGPVLPTNLPAGLPVCPDSGSPMSG